jgi:hypothetical protein
MSGLPGKEGEDLSCTHPAWTLRDGDAVCLECTADISAIPGEPWEQWFWNGNLKEALEVYRARGHECVLERGVLVKEDSRDRELRRLIEGDVVYRLWGGTKALHPCERNFDWFLLDYEGNVVREAYRGEG